MALIKCPECGKEFSEHAAKCPQCGIPIEVIHHINKEKVQREEEEKQRLADEQAEQQRIAAEEAWKDNKPKIIKTIIGIAICAVIGIGYWLYSRFTFASRDVEMFCGKHLEWIIDGDTISNYATTITQNLSIGKHTLELNVANEGEDRIYNPYNPEYRPLYDTIEVKRDEEVFTFSDKVKTWNEDFENIYINICNIIANERLDSLYNQYKYSPNNPLPFIKEMVQFFKGDYDYIGDWGDIHYFPPIIRAHFQHIKHPKGSLSLYVEIAINYKKYEVHVSSALIDNKGYHSDYSDQSVDSLVCKYEIPYNTSADEVAKKYTESVKKIIYYINQANSRNVSLSLDMKGTIGPSDATLFFVEQNNDGHYRYKLSAKTWVTDRYLRLESYSENHLILFAYDSTDKYIGKFDGQIEEADGQQIYSGIFTNYKGVDIRFNLKQ